MPLSCSIHLCIVSTGQNSMSCHYLHKKIENTPKYIQLEALFKGIADFVRKAAKDIIRDPLAKLAKDITTFTTCTTQRFSENASRRAIICLPLPLTQFRYIDGGKPQLLRKEGIYLSVFFQ